jgi:hypothetical protein
MRALRDFYADGLRGKPLYDELNAAPAWREFADKRGYQLTRLELDRLVRLIGDAIGEEQGASAASPHLRLPRDDTVLNFIRELWPADPIPGVGARERQLPELLRHNGYSYSRAQVARVIERFEIQVRRRGRPKPP